MMCFIIQFILFFFSSRRRHTRCALVTGSSDVCSSDLSRCGPIPCPLNCPRFMEKQGAMPFVWRESSHSVNIPRPCGWISFGSVHDGPGIGRRWSSVRVMPAKNRYAHIDGKSVVEGKGVSVRVELGGCRIIKKKK